MFNSSKDNFIPPYFVLEDRKTVFSHPEKPKRDGNNGKIGKLQTDIAKLEQQKPFLYTSEGRDLKNKKELIEEMKKREKGERATSVIPVGEYVNLFNEEETIDGKTPREILGVNNSASISEIHRQYRMLMRTYHPDRLGDVLQKMEEDFFQGVESGIGRGKYEVLLNESIKKELEQLKKNDEKYQKIIETKFNVKKINKKSGSLFLDNKSYQKLDKNKQKKYKKIIAQYKEEREKISNSRDCRLKLWEKIKQNLFLKVNQKAVQISLAWEQIKKGLDFNQLVGIESMWYRQIRKKYVGYDDIINLSQSKIVREVEYEVDEGGKVFFGKPQPAILYFARGLSGWYNDDYTGTIPVKTLFAFLENKMNKKINLVLLSDIASEFDLDLVQIKKIAKMFQEKVSASEMVENLEIQKLILFKDEKYKKICKEFGEQFLETVIEEVYRVVVGKVLDGLSLKEIDLKFIKEKIKEKYSFFALSLNEKYIQIMINFIKKEIERIKMKERDYRRKLSFRMADEFNLAFQTVQNELSDKRPLFKNRLINKLVYSFGNAQSKPARLKKELQVICSGPEYDDYNQDNDNPVIRQAGVEMTADGLFILTPYLQPAPEHEYYFSNKTFFDKKEIEILKQVAYGRTIEKSEKMTEEF